MSGLFRDPIRLLILSIALVLFVHLPTKIKVCFVRRSTNPLYTSFRAKQKALHNNEHTTAVQPGLHIDGSACRDATSPYRPLWDLINGGPSSLHILYNPNCFHTPTNLFSRVRTKIFTNLLSSVHQELFNVFQHQIAVASLRFDYYFINCLYTESTLVNFFTRMTKYC